MAPRGTKGERGKPAIEDLGFRPNGNAASLRNRRSRLVGLVQPSITNSFFAQMASEFGKLAIAHAAIVPPAPSPVSATAPSPCWCPTW